jgi:hypothetical protein
VFSNKGNWIKFCNCGGGIIIGVLFSWIRASELELVNSLRKFFSFSFFLFFFSFSSLLFSELDELLIDDFLSFVTNVVGFVVFFVVI